jgi:hypothetical protein
VCRTACEYSDIKTYRYLSWQRMIKKRRLGGQFGIRLPEKSLGC